MFGYNSVKSEKTGGEAANQEEAESMFSDRFPNSNQWRRPASDERPDGN